MINVPFFRVVIHFMYHKWSFWSTQFSGPQLFEPEVVHWPLANLVVKRCRSLERRMFQIVEVPGLVNIQKAVENHHFFMGNHHFLWQITIFYGKSPFLRGFYQLFRLGHVQVRELLVITRGIQRLCVGRWHLRSRRGFPGQSEKTAFNAFNNRCLIACGTRHSNTRLSKPALASTWKATWSNETIAKTY